MSGETATLIIAELKRTNLLLSDIRQNIHDLNSKTELYVREAAAKLSLDLDKATQDLCRAINPPTPDPKGSWPD